jgi:hypothetical protein
MRDLAWHINKQIEAATEAGSTQASPQDPKIAMRIFSRLESLAPGSVTILDTDGQRRNLFDPPKGQPTVSTAKGHQQSILPVAIPNLDDRLQKLNA